MKLIITLTIITALIFNIFILTLIFGWTKKNKKLKITTLYAFIAFLSLGGLTGYKLVTKSYYKVTKTLKPRTGDEIYDGLFGKRETNCVKVLNYQDQVVPKLIMQFRYILRLAQANSKEFYQDTNFQQKNCQQKNGMQKFPMVRHYIGLIQQHWATQLWFTNTQRPKIEIFRLFGRH